MVKKFKSFDPQLVFAEQSAGSAAQLTNSAKLSLYKKSQKSGIAVDVLEEVYRRGYSIWNESFAGTPEQFAFDRVNSFISGGFAQQLDEDLIREESEMVSMEQPYHPKDPNVSHRKKFHADKQKEIKEFEKKKMEEKYTGAEKTTSDFKKPASRFIGTDELTKVYQDMTPGQSVTEKRIEVIKKVVIENYAACENCDCGLAEELINERGADSKGYFRSTETGAGLTAKGAKHFGVQTAVTEKKPTGKRAARRRSFCARMSGMKGPMKDEKGRPTRKAMSLRRWRC